jgi:predicted transcriptional regulator
MIHLELQPEIEARFASEAEAQGMPLERYVESLLTSAFEEDEELREGLADIAAGRTRPAREVFAELHERYGIRG